MNSRRAASIAIRSSAIAAVLVGAALGTTGCTFITHQASTIQYSASDGVNIDDAAGPVTVRNAMIVATEDGSVGNLAAGLANTTDEPQTVSIRVNGAQPLTVDVPADGSVHLGAKGADDALRIDNLNVVPGASVEIFFQSGKATGASEQVPVLDGTLAYYADLVPQPEMTTLPVPTATPQSDEDAADAED